MRLEPKSALVLGKATPGQEKVAPATEGTPAAEATMATSGRSPEQANNPQQVRVIENEPEQPGPKFPLPTEDWSPD